MKKFGKNPREQMALEKRRFNARQKATLLEQVKKREKLKDMDDGNNRKIIEYLK